MKTAQTIQHWSWNFFGITAAREAVTGDGAWPSTADLKKTSVATLPLSLSDHLFKGVYLILFSRCLNLAKVE